MILLDLFFAFARIAMFSIGGGYAAMPLIRAEVVDARGLLTLSEFADLVTIAEMTPGPIQLNAATFAGMRAAGLLGAVCATLGVALPSMLLVSLLALVYRRYRNLSVIQGVLNYLRPAIVALIASAALDILLLTVINGEGTRIDGLGAALFALALLGLKKLKMKPITVMALCGAFSLLFGAIFGGI